MLIHYSIYLSSSIAIETWSSSLALELWKLPFLIILGCRENKRVNLQGSNEWSFPNTDPRRCGFGWFGVGLEVEQMRLAGGPIQTHKEW